MVGSQNKLFKGNVMIQITALYAAILALIFVYLSRRIIKIRRKVKSAIGDAGDEQLKRAIRAHANFIEYVPLALLLFAFLEFQHAPAILIHLLGILLVIGRIVHAYGLSQIKEDYRYRIVGTVITLNIILASAILIFVVELMEAISKIF